MEEPEKPSGPIPQRWALLMAIGLVVVISGIILGASANFLIDRPQSGPPVCDSNLVSRVTTTGAILARAGIFLVVLGMFMAAALAGRMDRLVRGSLFFGGALVIIFGLSIPTFFGFGGC